MKSCQWVEQQSMWKDYTNDTVYQIKNSKGNDR